MASFQNMIITTAGLELLQDLILEGGTPLTFSGVGVGDGLLEDSDITTRTSLVHEVHRLPIEKIEKQEGGHIRVFARLATDIITTDFYHRELGVFARHGEQEILFAYGNAGDDYDFIPATGNNASVCKTIVTEFSVGSMKAVFLPLDSKDFVTHEAMNAQVEEVIIRETKKVMEAIPQVDEVGNMTLTGGLTVAGTVNANGGINIPLAVGAATDTAAVNRAYALGMAQAAMMHQSRTYWLTSSCTATNGVTINHVVPGCYFEARIAANGSTSLSMQTAGVVGGANYSKILGYSLPIRCSGGTTGSWHKVSVLLGSGGQWTEQPDAGIDGWRWRPVAGSAPGITRLVEITIYYDNGYRARVRELIGIGNPKGYVVRTTESAFNYDHNSSPSTAGYRLVIAQSQISYTDVLAAGVWLIMGGNVSDTVIKLADIRGWDTYHTSRAPTLYLDAHAGDYGGVVQAEPPTILYGIGNNAYVRYGLEPYQRSWITSEAEAPYTEQPTE